MRHGQSATKNIASPRLTLAERAVQNDCMPSLHTDSAPAATSPEGAGAASELLIRQLERADASVYRAFRLRGLRDHPEAFTSSFEEENLRPLDYTEQRLAAGPNEKLWGAFVAGTLAGMVGLSRETRQKNRHKASLIGMYVAPNYAGQGIGLALVQRLLSQAAADGVELIVLTVTDGNARASALYASAGFACFGTEPDAMRIGPLRFGKRHMYLQLPALAP